MHEIGIATDFWDTIKRKAAAKGISRVTRVEIAVGRSSGIDPHLLRHSLADHIFPGTLAEHAEISVIVEDVSAKCLACGKEVTAGSMTSLSCPACGGADIDITSGKDAYVKSIEGN